MAISDFGARRTRASAAALLMSTIAVFGAVGALGAMVLTGVDLAKFERENAALPPPSPAQAARYAPLARTNWRIVHANLEARLQQSNPLELGAVWSTRTGRICGLVNGRGSFGGLTAMVNLSIHGNFIHGAIPQELDNLSELMTFKLGRNPFTGGFPDMRKLTKLIQFNFNFCSLTGNSPQPRVMLPHAYC